LTHIWGFLAGKPLTTLLISVTFCPAGATPSTDIPEIHIVYVQLIVLKFVAMPTEKPHSGFFTFGVGCCPVLKPNMFGPMCNALTIPPPQKKIFSQPRN